MILKSIKHPFILTIFGASGDLAKLKIFPSIFALAAQNRLPKNFIIVGYARSKKTREEFQAEFAESIEKSCRQEGVKIAFCEQTLANLLKHIWYFSGQYDKKEDFERYFEYLHYLSQKTHTTFPKTHIAYFSVPPSVFHPILQSIAHARSAESDDIRVVLEKPFGTNEKSAKKLFHFISQYYQEKQIFLLDHYLGKTAIQSILALRHNNSILNILLKGQGIANIQITAHETVGIEDRAGYFDTVGIIEDMIQSHLTQILAMVTMSIPITADARSFHREKYSILSALDFSPQPKNIFIGQYDGYQKIQGIKEHSPTETYCAVKLKIDRESWYGVPIFIRTGKKVRKKSTSVVVEFKKLPFQKRSEPNRLIFELQPEEMIHITLVNQYGESSEYHEITTQESIACRGDDCLPEHALLLLDVMNNRKLHFLSFPEILASWRITDRILHCIRTKKIPIKSYTSTENISLRTKYLFKKEKESWLDI